MKKPQFLQKTTDITNTQPHSVLREYELDFVPNDYFIDMLKKYGLYERPILDKDGNVITHYADIMAAKANGNKQMEVYEVDMDEKELTLFILSKHTYTIKKAKRSFQIAVFYRDYLTSNSEGIKLAKTIKGNINKKIAFLMDTSESTVKRLLYIGQSKKAEEHFNMIEEGHKSLQEIRGIVNEEINSTSNSKKGGNNTEQEENDSNDFEPDNQSDGSNTFEDDEIFPFTPDKPIQIESSSFKVNGNNVSYVVMKKGSHLLK